MIKKENIFFRKMFIVTEYAALNREIAYCSKLQSFLDLPKDVEVSFITNLNYHFFICVIGLGVT